ncbi:MAG: hypothetical protein BroJett026_34600 [Betaproteobacteria bacterium]|nr:MAG: hypothetical protein BroJett026_34600 [Betaproteobacteria bacterium]
MAQGEKEYGEGNYKATRQYNEATKEFIESGRVDEAARAAKPADAAEAEAMKRAEDEARSRAKEEDPALTPEDPQGVRVTDRAADQRKTPAPGRSGS